MWANAYNEKAKVMLIVSSIFLISFIGTASAVPQIFFTAVNLTMNNGTYHLWGEGLDARDAYSDDYTKLNIPITISRDINLTDVDGATLIHALAENLNMSDQWKQCVNDLSQTQANLSICQTDVGYKNAFETCQTQLNLLTQTYSVTNSTLTQCQADLQNTSSQRTILLIVAVVAGIIAWNYHGKINVKKVNTPYQQYGISPGVKQ